VVVVRGAEKCPVTLGRAEFFQPSSGFCTLKSYLYARFVRVTEHGNAGRRQGGRGSGEASSLTRSLTDRPHRDAETLRFRYRLLDLDAVVSHSRRHTPKDTKGASNKGKRCFL